MLELLHSLHISSKKLNKIKALMLKNEGGMLLLKYTASGWSPSQKVPEIMKYFFLRFEIREHDDYSVLIKTSQRPPFSQYTAWLILFMKASMHHHSKEVCGI